jgi:hypothetical protein
VTSPTDGPEPDAPVRVVERPALDRELDLGAPVVVRASPGVLTTRGGWSSEVQSSSALEAVPALVAAWVLGSGVMAAVLALSGIWSRDPEAALALSLGAGVAVVAPRKLWAAPLVVAGTGLAGMVLSGMDWPAIVGAGAAAGLAAALLFPFRVDWLDVAHGALGGLAGASIGLWAATHLVPASLPVTLQATLTAGMVSLLAAQSLLPLAVRFDQTPAIPSIRDLTKALKLTYRPPVLRALDLYRNAEKNAPDRDSRRGMAEVTTWVFRLQITLQTLDAELVQIDPVQVNERITAYRGLPPETDAFTKDRRIATVEHLERLLEHRALIETERRRTEAMVDYALAFLEEARAGLAVAQQLPGEAIPDRLPEVLGRLRSHANEGDNRRRTARELSTI